MREPDTAPDPNAHALVSALPIAAAAVIALARWLPIEFSPGPNPLGIVSQTIRDGYPAQKETFWLLFSTGAGLLLTLGVSRLLAVRSPSVATGVALEALGASALLAMLSQRAPLAEVVALGATGFAIYVARSAVPAPAAHAGAPRDAALRRGRWSALAWGLAIVAFALLLVPGLWARVAEALHGSLDDSLVAEGWSFHAEWGQHLAWANGLSHGQLPGRDLYCLYGPLYVLGLAGAWALFGRSIDVYQAWWAFTIFVGIASAMGLAAWHLRRRALSLAVPTLAFLFSARYGLGLLALLLLSQGFVSGRLAWHVAAGATGGVSLLFSQEFGAAFLLAAGAGFAVRLGWPFQGAEDPLRWREPAWFATGLVATVTPVLAWLAAEGALSPMLRDLAEYPSLVMQGFGKLPFPSLLSHLPLRSATFDADPTILARLDYATATSYVAAAALLLRVDALDPRAPIASLRGLVRGLREDPRRLALMLLAIFAILSFRSALGRSSLARTAPVAAGAALLLVVAVDRTLDLRRDARALFVWRAGALALFVILGGFLQHAAMRVPVALLGTVVESFRLRGLEPPVEAPPFIDGVPLGIGRAPSATDVEQVVAFVRDHTVADDRVLFLPNHASFYYLVDRPSPTRFVLSHQMVTDAHRLEALAALQASPPRYIVFAPFAPLLDGIPHETYIGSQIMGWIRENYVLERRIRSYEILAPRTAAAKVGDPP